MAPSARVQAAFRAMHNMGMEEQKTKRVLKKLLRVYDKNWKMIEEENYTVLVNAILDDDNNNGALGDEGNENIPENTDASQKRNALEDEARIQEESEPPLKRLRRSQDPSSAGASSAAVGLSGLKEPKPEPIDEAQVCLNPTGSEAAVRKKKGKQPISPQSLPLASQAELPRPSKKASRVNLEIAKSSSGEIKISLSCLQRPNFHVPRLDEVIKYMDEKRLSSYKAIDPSFSVTKLMKDFCECFLELATNSTIASLEKSSNHKSAVDALKGSTPIGDMHGGGCEGNPNMLPSSLLKSAIANGSDNAAEISVPEFIQSQSQDCGTKSLPANGELLDDSAGDKDSNGVLDPNAHRLVVFEQQQLDPYDELRLLNNADDITRGEEKVQITLLTEPHSGLLPSFHYMSQSVVYCNAHVKIFLARIRDRDCCPTCSGDCLSSSSPCMCSTPSRGGFTYTSEGLVKEEFLNEVISMIRNPQKHHLAHCKSVCPLEKGKNENVLEPCKGHLDRKFIKECCIKCGCSKNCVNRVVQRGISCKLQVFWTSEGKGWGLRTLDELPKGAFVCEYVGEVLTISELHQRSVQGKNNEKHSYAAILDADWSSKSLQENQTLCLDSTFYGNVARFINHRCLDANLVEIPVQIEAPDRHYYHVAFFTTRKVDANEELTWDYGIDFDGWGSHLKTFHCLCGSSFCRNMKRLNGSRPTSNAH